MLVAEGNRMVEYKDKQLKKYVFHANFNPIYNIEEAELTTIEIAAPNEKHAWDRLSWLIGSFETAERFRLDDVEPY